MRDTMRCVSSLNSAKRRSQPLPYSRPSTRCSCADGIGAADERSTASGASEFKQNVIYLSIAYRNR